MRKVIIIPARYASSRFPGKPLAIIDGKTMIERVVERCLLVDNINEIYVATDHAEIITKAASAGALFLTTGIHNSGSDRVAEAARMIWLHDNDVVINIQGDVPFIHPRLIEQLGAFFAENNEYDIVTAAKCREDKAGFFDRNNVKAVVDNNGTAISFTRNPFVVDRGENGAWLNHIGVYAYRNSVLQRFANLPPSRSEEKERLEQLRSINKGMKIKVLISEFDCGIDVNTPEDLVEANKIARRDGR